MTADIVLAFSTAMAEQILVEPFPDACKKGKYEAMSEEMALYQQYHVS